MAHVVVTSVCVHKMTIFEQKAYEAIHMANTYTFKSQYSPVDSGGFFCMYCHERGLNTQIKILSCTQLPDSETYEYLAMNCSHRSP